MEWAIRICDEKGSRAIVEASKEATMYGLYSKQGFRTIDSYDYIDENKFSGFEGVHLVTMIRDFKTDGNLVCDEPQLE